MKKILCIDTSFFTGAVGLMHDSDVIMSVIFNVKATYSEKLLYMIDMLCNETDTALADLSLIAVARGPGSFTGLRIGMSVAKTLAYVLKVPIVGVDTLATFAHGHRADGLWVIPFRDARKDQVFGAVYRCEAGQLIEEYPSGSYDPDAFIAIAARFGAPGQRLFITEDDRYDTLIEDRSPGSFSCVQAMMPDVRAVGLLGQALAEAGELPDVRSLEPLYGRPSDAELLYENRRKAHN